MEPELETSRVSRSRRFAKMDIRKHLGILCICVISLYFGAAVLDYVNLFSGSWGVITLESGNPVHVFYGPWQICWIVNNSFSCKNHSWKNTELLPSILLLYSVIIGKILFLGCLYQLICIFKFKWYISLQISVVLKVILSALSLILHIVVAFLPKEIREGQKFISLWNSELTVIISTSLGVVMMLVLLYELFFIMKMARPVFKNNSVIQIDGFMNPSFRSQSPMRTAYSMEQLHTDQTDGDNDFSWKDVSVGGSSSMVSAKHSKVFSNYEFSSSEYEGDYDSDSCSTGYHKRNFKSDHDAKIRDPKMATSNEEMSDSIKSQQMASKGPIVKGIRIKGKNNKKLPCVLGIKLRASVAQKIVDGHKIVPFNQTVFLLRRNIHQEWELDEMKPYLFQNLSSSDTELVIFEYKNSSNDESFSDETSNLSRAHSYPYYCPQNFPAPHSSKCNLALPTEK